MEGWQWAINLGFTFAGATIGWFLRMMWRSVQDIQSEIGALKVHLASNYVHKNDLTKMFEKLEHSLERIFDRLDGKADKEKNNG